VEKETSWSLIGGEGDKRIAHWWRRRQADRSLVEERTNGSLIGGEGDETDRSLVEKGTKRIAHWWRRGRNRSLIGDEIDLELMKQGVEAD